MDIPESQSSPTANPSLEEPAPQAESERKDLAQRTAQEVDDENRRIRRLQIMMNMVISVLSQEDMSLEEASELVTNAKRAALAMFPDKELAYDLLYKPRLQRLLRERFRLQ